MTLEQAIDYFGSVAALSRALGIKPASVSGWKPYGAIPIDRQCQIEVITGQRLVADRQALNMVTPQQQQVAHRTTQRQMQ